MAFDHRVDTRDKKSGRVISSEPYTKVLRQIEGGGTLELNERPSGSGIYFNADGSMNEKESEGGLKKQAAAEALVAERKAEAALTPEQRHERELAKAKALLEADALKKQAQPKGSK